MPDTSRTRRITAATLIATAIAVPAEGLRRVAYFDPPGILTVCMGHTGRDVIAGKVYSLAECDALLTDDMRKAVAIVEKCQPDLPENVLAAFADAAYNLGPKIACDATNSTAARKLRARDFAGACAELPKWDKARLAGVLVPLPGLTKRRELERRVCLGTGDSLGAIG